MDILVVDDEPFFQKMMGKLLQKGRHAVDEALDGVSALHRVKEKEYDLVLLDVNMPGIDGLSLLPKLRNVRPDSSLVIVSGSESMDTVIQALRLGADDFIRKPVDEKELDAVLEKARRVRSLLKEKRHLSETVRFMQSSENREKADGEFVGKSPSIVQLREEIAQITEAGCDTILITGETGSGKEVVARNIHMRAEGDEAPFIAVNCPAIPETLIESELFGHAKGSFTGATADRAGYFELAEGGTLFLDEIADLSSAAQASLLRVLETRIVRRIGSNTEQKLTLRVIAASNQPLEELVEKGKFRRDLYYRLNVYTIDLPPLRDRPEDILPLAERFIEDSRVRKRNGACCELTGEARDLLLAYHYPGNVRELKNLIERAIILSRSGPIGPEHLNIRTSSEKPYSSGRAHMEGGTEKSMITRALEDTKWNRKLAAKKLGMPYSTLRYKMDKLGID